MFMQGWDRGQVDWLGTAGIEDEQGPSRLAMGTGGVSVLSGAHSIIATYQPPSPLLGLHDTLVVRSEV